MKPQLYLGNCLEVMKDIPDKSVDLVLADIPYGTTQCKWDIVIPFAPMWEQLNRLIKPNGAIVLFGSEPFSSALRMSNIKNYKYDWIWNKTTGKDPFAINRRPMKAHENISMFCLGSSVFNPQQTEGGSYIDNRKNTKIISQHYIKDRVGIVNTGTREPISVLDYKHSNHKLKHPTQKPVPLMEYFILTYTNESETVLDFTMGSGTTGVACKKLGREFIGIEKDPDYFKIAQDRINQPVERPLF